ncbi:MAG TPA: hypothetical protein VNU66_09945 [Mycobacteriales bacterium]|nr:hypothetical protein [Mycobacteriales bacterium]
MRTPALLRDLDDRVLGDRGRRSHDRHGDGTYPDLPPGDGPAQERRHRPAGAVAREVLGVVWSVSRAVLLALALVIVVGIALAYAPTNDDNAVVEGVRSLAAWATGPFEDVLTADTERRALLYNHGLAAALYLLAASLVTRLPGGRRP